MAGRDGFTLVEVIVALVLLMLGALTMVSLSLIVTQANRGSTNRTRAFQVLYDKIEELHGDSYTLVVDGSDEVTIGDVSFTRSWDVDEDEPVSDVKHVSLTATWSDHDQSFQTTTTTLIGVR